MTGKVYIWQRQQFIAVCVTSRNLPVTAKKREILHIPITWPNINIFLWDQIHSISTIKLHIWCNFQLNISKNKDSMAKNLKNATKISYISVCAFCSISIINIATPPTFFYIFTWNFGISFSTKFGSYFIDRIFEFRILRHFGTILREIAPKWRQIRNSKVRSIK